MHSFLRIVGQVPVWLICIMDSDSGLMEWARSSKAQTFLRSMSAYSLADESSEDGVEPGGLLGPFSPRAWIRDARTKQPAKVDLLSNPLLTSSLQQGVDQYYRDELGQVDVRDADVAVYQFQKVHSTASSAPTCKRAFFCVQNLR